MTALLPGSFRDPAGHVFETEQRIFRSVRTPFSDEYSLLRDNGVYDRLVESGWLINYEEVDWKTLEIEGETEVAHVLEHPRLDYVSHPYEWSFSLLKSAAIFHLDFQLAILNEGAALKDATAYNVQFNGVRPLFIDFLSLSFYKEGQLWTGHKQFCEQFLNPLLLRACLGIPHNSWYRGNLEGIPSSDLVKLLPMRSRLSLGILSHVFLPEWAQRRSGKSDVAALKQRALAQLPRSRYIALIHQLRSLINGLKPADTEPTTWGDYAEANTYADSERDKKAAFVEKFVKTHKPRTVIDLGCNTGHYSEVCLRASAEKVVGFDFDQNALDRAYMRARDKDLNFTPLFLDASNPSPDQGWLQTERQGFSARYKADAVIALAFEHHLAIAKNVPLEQVVQWICEIAPTGVIEFVRKDDPTIKQMLAMREDIFPFYTEENFTNCIKRVARIVGHEEISSSGRTLYCFDRR